MTRNGLTGACSKRQVLRAMDPSEGKMGPPSTSNRLPGGFVRFVSVILALASLASCLPRFALPAGAIAEFETGLLSGDLRGSIELTAPIRFVASTPTEAPSALLSLKSDLKIGSSASFYGEIRGGYDGRAQSPANQGLLLRWDEAYPSKDRYLEIPEAHLDLYLPDLDLRAGIQKFAWGTLDQLNPTDNLSPMDLRSLFAAEASERKIGVPALRALYGSVSETVQIELVWMPILVPYRFPDPSDRWYPPLLQAPQEVVVAVPEFPLPVPLTIRQTNREPNLPARTFRHSEVGVRVARTLGNVDLGVSYFNGYDRRPVVRANGVVVADFVFLPPQADFTYWLDVRPDFHRMQVFGMDMAAGFGNFTIRAEAAYLKNRYMNISLKALDELVDQFRFPPLSEFTVGTIPDGVEVSFPYSPRISFSKNVLAAGGGADYQWGDHLLTFQVVAEKILNDHGEDLIYKELELYLLLATHSRFLQDTLQVETGLLHNPSEALWLLSGEATYALTDKLSAGSRLLLLEGKKRSPFGQYRSNDQIEFFVRYSF